MIDVHFEVWLSNEKGAKYELWLPRLPNVALLRALWSLLDGIWGVLKGSWGVLLDVPAPARYSK